MALAITPHTAFIQPVTEVTSGGVVTGYTRTASGAEVVGQLDQLTTQQALEQWGLDVSHPAVFYTNLSDRAIIHTGDRVTITSSVSGSASSVWTVVAGGQEQDAESTTSHVRWLLERST